MKLTIQRSLLIFGIAITSFLSIAFWLNNTMFEDLKVSGPFYTDIINGKDLIADTQPPPLYLVESYLLAIEIVMYPEVKETNLAQIAQHNSEYHERKQYWSKAQLNPALYTELTGDVIKQGDEYWSIMMTDFVPAATEDRLSDAKAALNRISEVFHIHDKSVDQLVTNATSYLAAAELRARTTDDLYGSLTYLVVGVTLMLLIVGLYVFYRRALVPLTAIRDYMGVITTGDYSQEVPYENRRDEIGEIARSVAYFRQAAIERHAIRDENEKTRLEKERSDAELATVTAAADADRQRVIAALSNGLEKLSAGDLTWKIEEAFAPEYDKLRYEFNASIEALAGALTEITTSTGIVRTSSTDIGSATENLALRTEKQAASLEQTASAIEQITATVRSSIERADEAATLVTTTRNGAESAGGVMNDAIKAMEQIENSSNQISQIISVIDDIAFQTNLLALNAGVEAARAGDAGKGFAVVAQEVRELAQRSAKAAKEIKTLIESSSSQVGNGVGLVNKTGSALAEIGVQVGMMDDHIRSIVAASREQTTALTEINSAVNQMDDVTQRNAAMVEQTKAATQGLRAETERLDGLLGGFSLPANTASTPARVATPIGSASTRAPGSFGRTEHTPIAASAASLPKASPARALGNKVASAFGAGQMAPSVASNNDWKEF